MDKENTIAYITKAVEVLTSETPCHTKFSHRCGFACCIIGWMANAGCEKSRETVEKAERDILQRYLDMRYDDFHWLFNLDAVPLTKEQTVEYLRVVLQCDGNISQARKIAGEHAIKD